MIIDFRIQPPFKSFLGIYFYRQRPPVQDPVEFDPWSIGRRESPSYVNRSIELFVEELDETGIDVAVIMGQQSGPAWGTVSNDDIGELIRRYPDKLVGFAGVDPHDAGAADEVRRLLRSWVAAACQSCPVGPTRRFTMTTRRSIRSTRRRSSSASRS